MSSKKGAFVYQQVELTAVEWAANTDLYPASTWLFERLESGKFNMKLSDGVHMFSELPAVMQDVTVVVKTNDETTYILTITTAAGSFDTPNLKPAVYTHPSLPARTSGLYKITVNNQGHVTEVVAVSKADITNLGIPAQDTNTTYSPATAVVDGLMSKADKSKIDGVAASANNYTHPTGAGNAHIPAGGASGQFLKWSASGTAIWAADNNTTYSVATTAANGLMSNADKQRVDKAIVPADVFTVTSLASLSPTKYSQIYTYTSATAQPINFAGIPEEGFECMLDIKNGTSSNITQAIPNATGWQTEDTSVVLPAGKITSISIRRVHGINMTRI